MQFRMGCAVWAFKGWVGEFYPAGSRASDFLRLYGDRLLTVEGNTTFYSVPNEETVARWAAETPPNFRFCLKVPRDVTHSGLLAPAMTKAIAFAERMAGLGERLGPFFAQLPPSYGPAQFEDLAAFVAAWPQSIAPLAVEVRHPQWFTPAGDRRLKLPVLPPVEAATPRRHRHPQRQPAAIAKTPQRPPEGRRVLV